MRLNLVGQIFGRLTVLEDAGRNSRRRVMWRCRCLCGKETTVSSGCLRTGGTRSCGCLRREILAKKQLIHGHFRHDKQSPTYHSWSNMIQRCTNPNYRGNGYARYRGVTICGRWRVFENFLADMGPRPEGTTLGRILDLGNYEPGNCFWQTDAEQGLARRNKRALLSMAHAA